jgi:hypothetical protein
MANRPATQAFLLMSALALAPGQSEAQWAPGGIPVCQNGCDGDIPLVVSDGLGGAFIAWRDGRNSDDIFLQHITGSGFVAPGWPADGLPIVTLPSSQELSGLSPDGQGGVLLVWQDFRNSGATSPDIYTQRILSDGTVAPGWLLNGTPATLAPDYQDMAAIAPDGKGGAFVVWEDARAYATQGYDIYAQHLTASGGVSPGWPANGLAVCTSPANQVHPMIVLDGTGGVVVIWGDLRSGQADIFAQHLLPDGTIAPGWADNGVRMVQGKYLRAVVGDGAAGWYVGDASAGSSIGSDGEYDVQRFTPEGAIAPGWPAGGVKICGAPGNRGGLVMDADGAGGVVATWYDYRPPDTGGEIYAARLLATGVLAAGWTADGVRVSDATNAAVEFTPEIARDNQGGAYIVWQSQSSSSDPSYVQHLTPTGGVAPGWPPYGVRVSTSSGQFGSQITTDGQGGAIVAWDDALIVHPAVWAQRFLIDGVVATDLSLVSADASPDQVSLLWQGDAAYTLSAQIERRTSSMDWQRIGTPALDGPDRLRFVDRGVSPGTRYAYRMGYSEGGREQFTSETWVQVPAPKFSLDGLRPNPALGALSVSFSLTADQSASLEVLDVSGRRVTQRKVGSLGVGQHLLRLEETSTLGPGIYWVRLKQGTRALLVRGAVVR